MYIENLGEIQAVAFDIDGTLYKGYNLNIRTVPFVLRHTRFFLSYSKTRREMHKHLNPENFRTYQLDFLAKQLNCSPEAAESKVKKTVHEGLKKYFARIKPYAGVVDFISELKEQGLKIALLSDLPPEQKGDIWGIKKMCEVTIWTEDTGAVKPSLLPFQNLVNQLGVPAENILYVGNHHKYDIEGAKAAGMKAAWIIYPLSARLGKKSKIADITFDNYEQLRTKLLIDKKI